MANPQLEEGHTRIANDILEAVSLLRMSGEESQVFWVVIRKTYGYQKTWDEISLSQFCLATGMNKQNVCRALSKLIKKNMIIKIDKGRTSKYRIQKDYTTWLPLSKLITLSKLIKPVIKNDKENVINIETHKRNKNTKEIRKERELLVPPQPNEVDVTLTQRLVSWMQKNDPKSSIIRDLTERRQLGWIDSCRLLRERDGRTPEEIKLVIDFSQKDDFWKSNILSMPKLREKFNQLWLKARPERSLDEKINAWAKGEDDE